MAMQTQKQETRHVCHTSGVIRQVAEHNHLGEPEASQNAVILDGMRREAENCDIPVPEVYQNAVRAALAQETASYFPEYCSVKSGLYKERAKRIPPAPQTAAQVTISGIWKLTTAAGQDFLLADSRGHEGRVLCFATHENLEILAKSSCWHMDGTFRTSPTPFLQLFTIHGCYRDRHLPLVYALLENKSAAIYYRLFQVLKDACLARGLLLEPRMIVTDFELGLLAPIRNQFPAAHHRGCHFHLCQAVLVNVKSLGLGHDYEINAEFRRHVHMLMSLCFLPIGQVTTCFEALVTRLAPTDIDCSALNEYFRNTWINGRFTAEMWNYWLENGPRTNSYQEGWHRGWNSFIAQKRPTIYRFLRKLKLKQASTEAAMMQIRSGGRRAPRKWRSTARERRLCQLMREYRDGSINWMEYLAGCSSNIPTRH